MTETPQVTMFPSDASVHLSQVYCGLALLARRGEIELSSVRPRLRSPRTGSILRIEIGGHRVVYDVRDHPTFPEADLDWAHTYFKRSFDPPEVERSGRPGSIYPLGLNYVVYSHRDRFLRNALLQVTAIRDVGIKRFATEIVTATTIGSRVIGQNGRDTCGVEGFEQSPRVDGTGVLLLTRTWDPMTVSGERAEMRAAMNRMRANSIRVLRDELGPRLVGGLVATPSAVRDYPDLVVDDSLTNKSAFLRALANSQVAVTTRGLLDTNGWRLAEYLAASRPIVSEPVAHRVPGPFAPDQNYLEFTDTDQLLASVATLLNDADRRSEMRRANWDYYTGWVRPDALIANSLAVVSDRVA
jgi:hypothetical protein